MLTNMESSFEKHFDQLVVVLSMRQFTHRRVVQPASSRAFARPCTLTLPDKRSCPRPLRRQDSGCLSSIARSRSLPLAGVAVRIASYVFRDGIVAHGVQGLIVCRPERRFGFRTILHCTPLQSVESLRSTCLDETTWHYSWNGKRESC